MIIGCGGIGSNIASVLTTSGFHNFILVDDDLIEESNLTRQYPFCYNDLEKPKVDILENYLRARNPDLKVKKYKKRITKIRDLEELPSCDLIVLSADSIGVTQIVNSYAVRTKTALLPVGYMGDLAVVGPFYIPHKSSCLAGRSKEKSFSLDVMKEVEKINILFQPPSFGPLNLMAVSFSSSEIIRYFSQQSILSVNRKVGLSLKDLVVRFVDYEPDEACLCYEI